MPTLSSWISNNPRKSAIFGVLFAVVFLSIVVWFRSQAFVLVEGGALDSNEQTLDAAIVTNANDLQNWYRSNLIIQAILICAGLLATISAASTNKDNTEILKKYTVVLTAITSTLAIVLTTFHIRENVETFIRANADLHSIEADYLAERAKGPVGPILRASAKTAEKAKAAGTPLPASELMDPPELAALWSKFLPRYLEVESARLHAWASVGQQSLPPPPKAPPPIEAKPDNGAGVKSAEANAAPQAK